MFSLLMLGWRMRGARLLLRTGALRTLRDGLMPLVALGVAEEPSIGVCVCIGVLVVWP